MKEDAMDPPMNKHEQHGPAVSQQSASRFVDSLAAVLKQGGIVRDQAVLEEYSSDHSFVAPCRPLLLVFPEQKSDVQAIVRSAAENGVPLTPVSSGPPRFHGDTVPAPEAAVVDFSRMNRVLKIDPVNRCAMVEPGVGYGPLIAELKKHGLRLNIPLLPRANKSVVASRLEREPCLIPKYQFDYVDPLLTLEVVYGTGDIFRTGSASGPGDLDSLRTDMVNPWGPGWIDYVRFLSGAQGTMGLVTWAVTKAEVLPSLQKLYFIPIEDVGALAAPMIRLLARRVVDECLALNNVNLAAILAETWPGDFEELKANLPPWTVLACVSGYRRRPEERVEIQEKYLKNICEESGLKAHSTLPGAEGREGVLLELLSGAWEKEPYWKLRRKGSCRDIFFLTTLSKVVSFIGLMNEVARQHRYPVGDIGGYVQPMVQGRGCHCEFHLPCDPSDPAGTAHLKRLFMDASEALLNHGAFFSRPYGPWAEMVYRGLVEEKDALRRLKSVFDPDNVLNPGRLCF